MMTEEEAKTKWCPAAKIPLSSLCIGSACMAWRAVVTRERPRLVQENEVDAWKRVGWTESGEPDGFGLVAIIPPPPQSEGFCGLAGKP
jgi:hypothetical protein